MRTRGPSGQWLRTSNAAGIGYPLGSAGKPLLGLRIPNSTRGTHGVGSSRPDNVGLQRSVETSCFRSQSEVSPGAQSSEEIDRATDSDDAWPPSSSGTSPNPRQHTGLDYVRIQMRVSYPAVAPGDVVSVVGGALELGAWNVGKAVRAVQTDGTWHAEFIIRPERMQHRSTTEYKFVLKRANGQILLEDGARRLLPTHIGSYSLDKPIVIDCQAKWPLVLAGARMSKARSISPKARSVSPPPKVPEIPKAPDMLDVLKNAFTAFQNLTQREKSTSPPAAKPSVAKAASPPASPSKLSPAGMSAKGHLPKHISHEPHHIQSYPKAIRRNSSGALPKRSSSPHLSKHQPSPTAAVPPLQPVKQAQVQALPPVPVATPAPAPVKEDNQAPPVRAFSPKPDPVGVSMTPASAFAAQMLAKDGQSVPPVINAIMGSGNSHSLPPTQAPPPASKFSSNLPADHAHVSSSPNSIGSPSTSKSRGKDVTMPTAVMAMTITEEPEVAEVVKEVTKKTAAPQLFTDDILEYEVTAADATVAVAAPPVPSAPPPVLPVPPMDVNAKITLTIFVPKFNCPPGEQLVLCGATQELGNWHPAQGLPLIAVENDIWVSTIQVSALSLLVGLEAKLACVRDWASVVQDAAKGRRGRQVDADWEPGPNRSIKISQPYSPYGRYLISMEWAEGLAAPLAAAAPPTTTCTVTVHGSIAGLPPHFTDEDTSPTTRPGRLVLVGSDPLLGSWNARKGVVLVPVTGSFRSRSTSLIDGLDRASRGNAWGSGLFDDDTQMPNGTWSGSLQLPLGGLVECKLVWLDDGEQATPVWEEGFNRKMLGTPAISEMSLSWRPPNPSIRVSTPRPKRKAAAPRAALKHPSHVPANAQNNIVRGRPAMRSPEPVMRSPEPPPVRHAHAARSPEPMPAATAPTYTGARSGSQSPPRMTSPPIRASSSPARGPFKVDLDAGAALRAARMASITMKDPLPSQTTLSATAVAMASSVLRPMSTSMSPERSMARSLTPSKRPSVPTLVHILVPAFETRIGQVLLLVGNDPALGSWDPEFGLMLQPCDGGGWVASVSLPSGIPIEAKLVLAAQKGPVFKNLPDGRTVASFTVNASSITLNSTLLFQEAHERGEQQGDDTLYIWEEAPNRVIQAAAQHCNLVVCEWGDTRWFPTLLDTIRCDIVVPNKVVPPGHWIAVTGDHPALGKNQANSAPVLRWTYGNTWRGYVDLPREVALAGVRVKLLICSYGDEEANSLLVETEPGTLRLVKALDPNAICIRATMKWGEPKTTQLMAFSCAMPTGDSTLESAAAMPPAPSPSPAPRDSSQAVLDTRMAYAAADAQSVLAAARVADAHDVVASVSPPARTIPIKSQLTEPVLQLLQYQQQVQKMLREKNRLRRGLSGDGRSTSSRSLSSASWDEGDNGSPKDTSPKSPTPALSPLHSTIATGSTTPGAAPLSAALQMSMFTHAMNGGDPTSPSLSPRRSSMASPDASATAGSADISDTCSALHTSLSTHKAVVAQAALGSPGVEDPMFSGSSRSPSPAPTLEGAAAGAVITPAPSSHARGGRKSRTPAVREIVERDRDLDGLTDRKRVSVGRSKKDSGAFAPPKVALVPEPAAQPLAEGVNNDLGLLSSAAEVVAAAPVFAATDDITKGIDKDVMATLLPGSLVIGGTADDDVELIGLDLMIDLDLDEEV